jgi:hypothetical protein
MTETRCGYRILEIARNPETATPEEVHRLVMLLIDCIENFGNLDGPLLDRKKLEGLDWIQLKN